MKVGDKLYYIQNNFREPNSIGEATIDKIGVKYIYVTGTTRWHSRICKDSLLSRSKMSVRQYYTGKNKLKQKLYRTAKMTDMRFMFENTDYDRLSYKTFVELHNMIHKCYAISRGMCVEEKQ